MSTPVPHQIHHSRVFISYTGHDLTAHAAVAVAEAEAQGWEPVDHRHWEPSGRSSVGECLRRVDACDALIVLSGGRYGWVPSAGEGGDGVRSITHLEVAQARQRGMAVIPMLLEDGAYKAVAAESEQRPQLDAFRAELQSTLARFFSANPESVRDPVRLGLQAWDGRKNDDRMRGQRALRRLIPLAWIGCAFLAWMGAGPALWAGWTLQTRMSPDTWLLQPATLAVIPLLVLLAVAWTTFADRGRPQWMYRLFPLSWPGMALLGVTGGAGLLMVATAVHLHRSPDPLYEHLLQAFMEKSDSGQASKAIGVDAWRGARFESEVAALQTYVTPVSDARALLSRKLSLADVRTRLSRLAVPAKLADSRMQLMVNIAHFEELAMTQDAGAAQRYYQQAIAPRLADQTPLWRAHAKYALASWMENWAFTNRLEQINREGATKYDGPSLVRAWDDVLSEVPPVPQRPPRIRCAALITRGATLSQLCGVTGQAPCQNMNADLREAWSCAQSISDKGLARTARANLSTWLMAKSQFVEALVLKRADLEEYKDLHSGMQAMSIQAFASVAPAGQEISTKDFRELLKDETDVRRRAEYGACVNLLDAAGKPDWAPVTRDCRVAFTCFMTDNPAANRAICTVPEPDAAEAVPVGEGGAVTLASVGVWLAQGTVTTAQPASQVMAECDGAVGSKPVITVNVQQAGRLVARVKSADDSVLLVRGPGQALCTDASSKDAGVIFDATPGSYEFFVGRFGDGELNYQLLLSIGRR